MRITKNDKARVIVAALYNMDAIADADDPRVTQLSRKPASHLDSQHQLALKIIADRQAA